MWQNLDPLAGLRQDRLAFETGIGQQEHVLQDPEGLLNAARRALAAQALERALWSPDLGVEGGVACDLIEFALETFTDAPRLRQYRSVERRLRWSPRARRFSQLEKIPYYKRRFWSEITHHRGT